MTVWTQVFPSHSAFKGSFDASGSCLKLSSFSCVTFSWGWFAFKYKFSALFLLLA